MISILFSSHNGEKTLPRMLSALEELDLSGIDLEIIAVDNASTDRTSEILCANQTLPIKVLSEPRRGKNVALNSALKIANGDLLVFTDDDVIPDRRWLQELKAAAEELADFAVLGGSIRPDWPHTPSEWVVNFVPLGATFGVTDPNEAYGETSPMKVWGANMMVRRAVFESGLSFNELVGPSTGQYVMGSESEFNMRASKAGWRCGFVPNAVVHHIIRDFQMTDEWVINRAFRYGRSCWAFDEIEGKTDVARLFGYPRWAALKLLKAWLAHHKSRWTGNDRRGLEAAWELSFFRGYLNQSRISSKV